MLSKKWLGLIGVLFTQVYWPLWAQADDFTLVKKQASIALYERWIQHNNNPVRELKVEFVTRTISLNRLLQLLQDESKGKQWNRNAIQYKVAHQGNAPSWLLYIRYNLPWPLSDQDCCLRYSMPAANNNHISSEIFFESSTDPRFTEKAQVTRLTGVKGKWVLEPLNAQTCRVTYFIATNRSSSIPRWVSDPLVYNNLLQSMSSFKTLLEK